MFVIVHCCISPGALPNLGTFRDSEQPTQGSRTLFCIAPAHGHSLMQIVRCCILAFSALRQHMVIARRDCPLLYLARGLGCSRYLTRLRAACLWVSYTSMHYAYTFPACEGVATIMICNLEGSSQACAESLKVPRRYIPGNVLKTEKCLLMHPVCFSALYILTQSLRGSCCCSTSSHGLAVVFTMHRLYIPGSTYPASGEAVFVHSFIACPY